MHRLSKLTRINGCLANQITNAIVYDAYLQLTEKQKKVLNLAFVQGLNDTRISEILNVSQQNISKTRKKALISMRIYLEERDIYGR